MSRSVYAGALVLAIGLVTPRAAFAEPSATPAIALEPSGITGYGGAEFKVTWPTALPSWEVARCSY